MNKLLPISLFAALLLSVGTGCAQSRRWAVVDASSCFLRAKPDYESPLESQCRMGTVLEVTDSDRYWRKVDAPDYRDCWTNDLALAYMDEGTKDDYIAAPKWICTAAYSHIYADAAGKEVLCDFTMGDIVRQAPASAASEVWTEVVLASGRRAWARSSDVADFAAWAHSRSATPDNLIATAKGLLGTPYMWGGNTVKYFDCSGFTQFVYFQNGIVLPRNAREQILIGEEVPFDFGKMQAGDLVFFGRAATASKPAAVTHVALYIGDGRIIHSSQLVRINSLRDGLPDSYGRTPIGIRRILGEGAGSLAVGLNPWYFRQK